MIGVPQPHCCEATPCHPEDFLGTLGTLPLDCEPLEGLSRGCSVCCAPSTRLGGAEELSYGSHSYVWPGRHHGPHGAHTVMASATVPAPRKEWGRVNPGPSLAWPQPPERLQEAQPFFQENGLGHGGQHAPCAPLRLPQHSAPADSPLVRTRGWWWEPGVLRSTLTVCGWGRGRGGLGQVS